MKEELALTFYALLLEESPINQFLGSPLLILAVIIVIDIIAFLYRKFRK